MQFQFGNLTTRILLIAALLATVPIVVLAAVFYAYEREELLREREADLVNHFLVSSTQVRQVVDMLRRDAVFLAHAASVSGIRGGNGPTARGFRLQDIFVAFIEANPRYYQLHYVAATNARGEQIGVGIDADGKGRVIPTDQLQDVGWAEFFQQMAALDAGEVGLSEIGLSQIGGASVSRPVPALRAATPVFAPEGNLLGMIVISVAVSDLLKNVSLGLPAGVLTYLTNQSGDYLVHPDPQRVFGSQAGQAPRWQDEMRGITPAETGHQATPHLAPVTAPEGLLHVLAGHVDYDPLLRERKLFLAYALPDSRLQSELKPIRALIGVGTLLAIGLAIGLIVFLLSRIFAPLRGLTAAASTIADGRYDTPVPRTEYREIDALGQALRHMQQRVAARENDLLNLAGNLETRVAARTADLQLAASVFEHTTEGVMVADAATCIVSINPAFTAITGYTADEAIGKKTNLLRSDRQGAEFYKALWKNLNLFGYWQGEIWNRRKNGEVYLEWLTINRIVDGAGRPYRYVAVFHDITDTHRKAEHMRHLAYHDALTGLPNRLLLEDRLSQSMAAAHREGNKTGLLFIDLDRFKQVNDSHGHLVGDQLLEEVARRLKACVRDSDTVARLGGDEFVILLPKLGTPADGAALAEKLIASLSAPMSIAGHTVEIGASVGIAVFPADGDTPEEIMKNADAAMYAAKTNGRGVFVFYAGHQAV